MAEKRKITFKGIVSNIINLVSSRLVFGGLLAFLGFRVALDPNSAPKKIAWGLGLAILIAMGGLLIGFITTKGFKRANLFSIIETIIFTLLGAAMIIFSEPFGNIIEEMVFVIIIVSCTVNIMCLKNFRDIKTKIDKRMEDYKAKEDEKSVIQGVRKAIKDDFVRYNGEFINAADYIKKKTDKTTWGQLVLNILLIVFAFFMLVTRYFGMSQFFLISGIIMLLSGLNEIVLGIRSLKEMVRVRKAEGEGTES